MRYTKLVALMALLVALTASMASAFTFEGQKPLWWDNPNNSLWLKAEWNADPGWNAPGVAGPAPNSIEWGAGMDPLLFPSTNAPWEWYNHGVADVSSQGLLVKGKQSEWDIALGLGNHQRLTETKNWYLELALDGVPLVTDAGGSTRPWDPVSNAADADRFTYTATGWLSDDSKAGISLVNGGTWKKIAATTSTPEHLVWYAEWQITPQPEWEKLEIRWNTNHSAPWIENDFRIARVTTGTKCTPEPASGALLLLGTLGVGAFRRRRRAAK